MGRDLFVVAASAWLRDQGRSQAWLADTLGVSAAHVSNVLAGKRGLSLALARRLAEVIGCGIVQPRTRCPRVPKKGS